MQIEFTSLQFLACYNFLFVFHVPGAGNKKTCNIQQDQCKINKVQSEEIVT